MTKLIILFVVSSLGLASLCFAAPYSYGTLKTTDVPQQCNGTWNMTTIWFPCNESSQERFEVDLASHGLNLTVDQDGRMDLSVSAPTNYDCTVRGVPSHVRRRLRLSTFYSQYVHAYGIPVVASYRVKRKALERACYVLRFLFADRKDIRDWFYRRNGRAAIMAEREGTTSIPEHSFLPAWWNQRARGLGATIAIPVSTGGEENLLCLPSDRYRNEDIFLHEFVHGIHNLGATGAIRSFDYRLRAAYNSAKRRGLWRNTYAMSTDREYFSEGTQSFFEVNAYSARPNGIHNHVNTRAKLLRYDPTLYNLVKEVFPCANIFHKRCDASKGKQAPSFKRDCAGGGGTVVTPAPPKPGQCTDDNVSCPGWAARGECQKNPVYMLVNCKKSCNNCKTKPVTPPPPKPDTPPPPKPDTPPPPTPPPPKPDTPPPPKPDTPPPPTPPKPDTPPPPKPTPPKPTPPKPTPPKPTPPKPTPPKPTPPIPTPPIPTPPIPTPPIPTPPIPTPPKPTPPKPSCRDRSVYCSSWASIGECSRNPGYMKISCCRSCNRRPSCSDSNTNCRTWAQYGYCRYLSTKKICRRSCRLCT